MSGAQNLHAPQRASIAYSATHGSCPAASIPLILEAARRVVRPWFMVTGDRAAGARRASGLLCALVLLVLPACAARSNVPGRALDFGEGLASWYGPGFHGRTTASGTRFNMHALVAAHPTYPFGTVVRVTNLANGRSAQLRILDRGPAQGPQSAGVLIDVSYGAARRLDFIRAGLTRVRIEVLRWGDGRL